MLTINILTIFPEAFSYLDSSLLGKAVEKKLIKFNIVNIRDYSQDKHHKVDDEPFGGGAGMVMQADPIFRAVEDLKLKSQGRIILTSPQGQVFTQKLAGELAQEKELTIICGRYEGIDERVVENLVTDEISIGDYVLTGGELPAMVMIDALSRYIKGVVGKEDSVINDSFYDGNILDHPQYTRPAEYRGWKVPEVLLNGNHKEIEAWRKEQAIKKTKKVRPDLF